MDTDQAACAWRDSLIEESESPTLPTQRKHKLLSIDLQARMDFQCGGLMEHVEADDAGIPSDRVEDQAVAGTEDGNGVSDGIHFVLAGRMVTLSFLAISGERSARIA